MRNKSLTEEVNALRAALAEREEIISKMRVEVHQYSTRVINYKVLTMSLTKVALYTIINELLLLGQVFNYVCTYVFVI